METITIAGAVIAVVSLAKEILPTQVVGWVTILLAVIIGLVAGVTGFQGLNIVTGILTALAAVGTVTVAKKIGS